MSERGDFLYAAKTKQNKSAVNNNAAYSKKETTTNNSNKLCVLNTVFI